MLIFYQWVKQTKDLTNGNGSCAQLCQQAYMHDSGEADCNGLLGYLTKTQQLQYMYTITGSSGSLFNPISLTGRPVWHPRDSPTKGCTIHRFSVVLDWVSRRKSLLNTKPVHTLLKKANWNSLNIHWCVRGKVTFPLNFSKRLLSPYHLSGYLLNYSLRF